MTTSTENTHKIDVLNATIPPPKCEKSNKHKISKYHQRRTNRLEYIDRFIHITDEEITQQQDTSPSNHVLLTIKKLFLAHTQTDVLQI